MGDKCVYDANSSQAVSLMERWIEFIGHFHPLLVHLPVGILLLISLLVVLSHYQKIQLGDELLKLILILGAVSSLLSCFTGLMLARNEEYDFSTLSWHQWMGISVATVSIVNFFLTNRRLILVFSSILLILLLSLTGHLGGTLTHGSNYLSFPSRDKDEESEINLSLVNLDRAKFYADLVRPILKSKCYSCHSQEKQKGKLRLDEKEFILRGGKHGAALIPSKPNDSELISRVELDISNKEHMPPKEKPQLTYQEKEIISLWIEAGADFEQPAMKAKTFRLVEEALKTPVRKQSISNVPDKSIKPASDSDIRRLIAKGVVVTPIANESPYLSVSLIGVPSQASNILSELTVIGKNVIWLKLSATNVDNASLPHLEKFSNLTRLSLDNTKISDKGLQNLSSLIQLQNLNLTGTSVSLMGLEKLTPLVNLHSLYLYKTNVKKTEEGRVRQLFPQISVEFGDYMVPTLESDTTIVKIK
jgi:hypothetical protein